MPVTVLLTLGRLPKCVDLARGFAAAGARVLIAEPHRWHMGGCSRSVQRSFTLPAPRTEPEAYGQALLELIDQQQVDWVVPVSEETLHVIPLLHAQRPRVSCFGPSPETLLQLHDKLRFADLLAQNNLPVPTTLRADDPAATALALHQATVLKARASCAGDGLEFLAPGAAIPTAKANAGWLVQARQPGPLTCSFAVVVDGQVLATVAYRARLLSGTVAVCFERINDADWYHGFSQRVATLCSYTGFLAFDFIAAADAEPVPIECNPRVTSGVHFLNARDVASAILGDAGTTIGLGPYDLMQQFYPSLTEVQKLLLKNFKSGRAALPDLFRAREVSFKASDPGPFLLQPIAAWPIMSKALFGGMSFGAAATQDIEWNGSLPR